MRPLEANRAMRHCGASWDVTRLSRYPCTGTDLRELAERVGFEPTCRLPDKTLSRRPRYDHFGTSPLVWRPRNYTPRAEALLALKNSCTSSRHGASSTPAVTANRWFSPGVSSARTVETIAPVFGSAAP